MDLWSEIPKLDILQEYYEKNKEIVNAASTPYKFLMEQEIFEEASSKILQRHLRITHKFELALQEP